MKTFLHSIKYICLVILFCVFGTLWSQTSPQVAKGDKYFFNQEYDEAISMYMLAYQMDESSESTRRLAETYKRIGQMETCAKWLKTTIEIEDRTPEDILKYAEILKIMENYPEAIFQYKEYSKLKPGDQRAQEHIRNEYYYEDLWSDSLKYRMHILGINSELETFGVIPYEDKYLFSSGKVNDDFCVKADKKKDIYLDIYECILDENEQFTEAVRLKEPVNTKYHDGPMFYDENSQIMYITRNNMKGNRPIKNKKGDIILKIYTTELIEGEWSEVEELSLNSEEYSTGHPCLSSDGNILYFISNRPEGYGGTDIYKSYWDVDHWGEPINLGSNVNTEGNEMFPYVSKEGIIYFASDGHAGLGGLDNFMCEPWGDNWSIAYNLGSPINTNFDDFSLLFVPGDEIGFFSSNRSGKGFGDVYFFKQIDIIEQQLAGKLILDTDEDLTLKNQKIRVVYAGKEEEILIGLDSIDMFKLKIFNDQKVEFYMADTSLFMSDKIVAYNAPSKFYDPAIDLGVFVIRTRKQINDEQLASKVQEDIQNLISEMDDLAINTEKMTKERLEKIEASILNLEQLEDDSLMKQLMALRERLTYLENLIYEKEYIVYDDTEMFVLKKEIDDLNINKVYFGFDSFVITAKASTILDSVYFHMTKNPSWKIEIDTHTDSRGSAVYNRYLSEERANSVRRYLKRNGITNERILLRWHGENDLVATKETEDAHRLNRRAEFRYLVVSDRSKDEKKGFSN